MSKAILVMDMPKNCAECSLCNSQDAEYFCIPDDFDHYLGTNYVSHNATERPEWCPLKEVPEKNTKQYSDGYKYGKGYQRGCKKW